jgi:tetratricopeptide (TPR) repeat protein/GH24 family phage-related lysozyme (muramidase)
MSEKFRDIVNLPHRAFGLVTREIMRTQPDKWYGKVAKGAGMTMTGLAQFLFWATKYITLDNHALRAVEKKLSNMRVKKNKKGENKKLQEFIKQHPNLTSHVMYYMLIVAIAYGIKAGVEVSDIVESVKIERETERAKAGTYAEYLDKMRGALPYLVADLVAKEGVHVENGMHTPYLDGQGVWTIGFGSTVLKDGTRVNKNTPPITTQQAYELACWHIMENETLFRLYCYDVVSDNVDINRATELVALSAAMYNVGSDLIEQPKIDGKRNRMYEERFLELDSLHKKYGNAITNDMVREVFAKYPIEHMTSVGNAWLNGSDKDDIGNNLGNFLKGGNGLRWRRWLEAQVMKGNIQPEVFLKVPVGGFYEFYRIVGDERENWFIEKNGERVANDETLKRFYKWLEKPVNKHGKSLSGWKTAADWLPADVAQQCLAGKCEIGAPSVWDVVWQSDKQRNEAKQVEVKTYVIGYDELYADAVGAYQAGKFDDAVKKYQNMITQYPDNALLRNDLAATYNRLGKYNEAIKQASEVVQRIGDKSQYGAAQYNAGFAYEQLGNLQKALANYKLALANGNRGVQKDITRVSEKLKRAGNKKVAFNSGIKQIHQKNAKSDLLLYGQEFKGNMA